MIKRVMDLITSMREQGMSLSLVWHWHVRTGSSPDQVYGAQPALEANVNIALNGRVILNFN